MSIFGNTSNTNPLFGGKPTTSIFGNTPQTNPQTNPLANAPPLGTTTQNQPTGTSIFGQQNQPQQQQPATTGSLFGNTAATNQPTTSLFGNTSTQQQPGSTGGGLFGNASTTQPQTGTSLFGNTGTQQQQHPNTGGSLFGSTTQQPGQQTGTTSLFGNTGQQQTGTPLFGNTATNTSQLPTGATNLFGSAPSQQPQTASSLFGNAGTQQTGGTSLFGNTGVSGQQQQGGTSLFGNTSTTNQPQTGTTSLFGNTGAATFGSTTQPTQSTGGAFGTNSLFGPKPTTNVGPVFGPTQTPQQVQTGQIPFTKSTKFNDLPDNVKHLLESIDTHIQGRVQISKDLHQRKLGEEPTKGQEMIKQTQKELLNTSNVIRNDLRHTEDLKIKVDQAMQDTIVASRIIDAFRNPQGGTTYLKDHAGFPFEFFQRVTQQMVERLTWYKTTIEQIERRLSSSAGQVQTPQGIAATLQAQNTTFLSLASKTAALEAELQKVKALYTQLWRGKTGSVRDPFNEGDRLAENPGDLGFGGLGVK